jgi:hypothetical protein
MQSIRSYVVGAIGAAFFIALGSLLSHNAVGAASSKSTAPPRGYYLTTGTFSPSAALTACVSGYHMASYAEIADVSNVSYNTTLGTTAADSGFGPPSNQYGWIRTGYPAGNANGVGSNCGSGGAVWISDGATDYGTIAAVRPDTQGQIFIEAYQCSSPFGPVGVWCVQD